MPNRPVGTRRCVACRLHDDKSAMVRICRAPDGNVFLDESGKADGRGLWVHATSACIDVLVKKRAVNAVLGAPLPDEVKEQLYAKV